LDQKPLIWSKELNTGHLEAKIGQWNGADIDLGPLWEACPFRRRNSDKLEYIRSLTPKMRWVAENER